MVYQVVELDVSSARSDRDFADDGLDYSKFKYISALTIVSSPIEEVNVKLNSTAEDAIPLSEGDKLREQKINKLYFSCTSTSSTKVKVYVEGPGVR